MLTTIVPLTMKCDTWIGMVLIIQILGACVSTGVPLTSNQVQFKTVGKIPIIEGKINGKRAYFIVDTGASISLLNESEAKHFGFGASSETGHTLVGFSGESKIKEAYNCTVEFGAMTIRGVTFKARCMKDFTAVIHQYESIKISGIIGSDVFDKYRITIDYRNSTISF